MRIRVPMLTMGMLGLVLLGAAVFVQRQWAQNMDDRLTDPSRPASIASAHSDAPHLLPKNPDGLEFERTIVLDTPFSATLITESIQRIPGANASIKEPDH